MNKISLSIILLALNEEKSVVEAINDIRSFAKKHLKDHEIIVVDDGSTDNTPQELEKVKGDDLKVITHRTNMGMGKSLADGYAIATKPYATFLPADRQLRADSIAEYLPFVAPKTVVLSNYPAPLSGTIRAILSFGFRLLMRKIGNLHINFEGSYIFPTKYFKESTPPEKIASTTFMYSFQLLDGLRLQDCNFKSVIIQCHIREHGTSKVANANRIIRIIKELLTHRKNSR